MFVFNDTATTEIYTLSLHDALPIWRDPPCAGTAREGAPALVGLRAGARPQPACATGRRRPGPRQAPPRDRKSTRLNSSHANISYAVFCLKKKQVLCQ